MSQHVTSLPNRYEVVSALGGGGGGNVYRVRDKHLGTELALKRYAPESSGRAADEDSFRAEFLLCASLSHPNLTKVFDFGYDADNQPFFTMELAGGTEADSTEVLKSERHFLLVLGQICSAMKLLHHFGYSHNDLKPANVRVDWKDGQPITKVLDFGLAREYDPARAQELSGTVEYMAPELFASKPPSKLSDIYGLGVILYEMVSGRLPYSDQDPLAVISGHVEKDLPPLESRVPFMKSAAVSLISRMLEKNPSDRPRSVTEVYDSFVEALGYNAGDLPRDLIVPYFESALLHQIQKSPDFQKIADSGKSGAAVGCTDENLARTVADFVKKTYQTKFINVLISADELSKTSVHAPDAISVRVVDMQTAESGSQAETRIVNVGNYGEICSQFVTFPLISGDSIIPAATESLFGAGDSTADIANALLHMSCGDTGLAELCISRLFERKAITYSDGHFNAQIELFERISDDDEIRGEISGQVSFLDSEDIEVLKTLAVFDHAFTGQMALSLLSDGETESDNRVDKLERMRIIDNAGGSFQFRHSSIQEVLYGQLDQPTRERLHRIAAKLLSESEQFDKLDQTGMLSKHLLLSGEIERGIAEAVKYQKLQVERGEFLKPEVLLLLGEQLLNESGLKNEKVESRLLMAFGDLYKQQGRADAALEIYQRIVNMPDVEPLLLAETYKDLGDIYKFRMEFSAGIESLGKALQIYQDLDNQLEISHTLNNMGNMHWVNSEYDLALESYESALKIQEQLDAVRDVASTLTNIGSTFFAKRDFVTAIDYYTRSVEIKKQIDDQPELARTYNNVALAYYQIGESGKALNFLNKAMVINRKIGSQKELMFNLENTADVCLGLGENQRAEELSVEGFDMARKLEDLPHQGIFTCWLGTLNSRRGMYGKALEYLNAAESVTEKITDKPFTARNLLQKAQTYILLNDLKQAGMTLERVRKMISPLEVDANLVRLKHLTAELALRSGDDPGAVISELDEVDRDAIKQNLNFELCESLVTRLQAHSLSARIPAEPLEALDKLIEMDQHTIFRSYLYFYLGIGSACDRLYNEAQSYFDQASLMASEYEQRELLWKIDFHIGKVYLSKLEYEEAFRSLRKAGGILKDIACGIGDQSLLKGYMRRAEILEFLDSVKHLETRLA
ncbi:MAG: serine/threonine-protein kinase [Candidatus Zixiibacteriota bacterium]